MAHLSSVSNIFTGLLYLKDEQTTDWAPVQPKSSPYMQFVLNFKLNIVFTLSKKDYKHTTKSKMHNPLFSIAV